jgi:hypothetical protein
MTTAARAWFRTVVAPLRLRVTRDPENMPIVRGARGRIESYCEGGNCHGCPERGPLLAVWTDRPRLFMKLKAIPGVSAWQIGDREARFVFPGEALEQVAAVIHARRRRPPGSAAHLQKPPQPPLQGDFRDLGTRLAPGDEER